MARVHGRLHAGFDAGRISIYQTLAVVPGADGASGMPWRRDW